jgi:hypothetical protein
VSERIELPDQCFATAELHENGLSVAFKVFDRIDFDGPAVGWHGFVKWDGCSNWSPGDEDENVMAHFCDEGAERAFGEMLVTLRREALRIMGDNAIFVVVAANPTEHAGAMEALLREFSDVSPIVECYKCNLAQVGPDGKVVLDASGVMVPRNGADDFCRFDPSLTDGECPRCGRSSFSPVDEAADRLSELQDRARVMLAEIDAERAKT